jgi:hypothetical protein
MMEGNSRGQQILCSMKGRIHGGGPLERLLTRTGISERTEDMSNARQETAIEIEHAKKTLKGRQICWRRKGEDRLHLG